MTTATDILPLEETITPSDQDAVADTLRQAYQSEVAVYPIGGATSLDFGMPAKTSGIGLLLTDLNRVVDYPHRDMTITVESGITIAELIRTLAAQRQRLPLDVAQSDCATLGGLMATNFCGPRRYGWGTIRDYVVGISAVDGAGRPFKGGGRVVKNVAGYDFCKMLTGSLGMLGVITQATLKVVPICEASLTVTCEVSDFAEAEAVLAALVNSQTTPAAIDLQIGDEWFDGEMPSDIVARISILIEGTKLEVGWMAETLETELKKHQVWSLRRLAGQQQCETHDARVQFAAADIARVKSAQLVIKAGVLPSQTVAFCQELRDADPKCDILAHAGNGIVLARLYEPIESEMSRLLIRQLIPSVSRCGGNLAVLSGSSAGPLTSAARFFGPIVGRSILNSVREKFDPGGILNPSRFVFA